MRRALIVLAAPLAAIVGVVGVYIATSRAPPSSAAAIAAPMREPDRGLRTKADVLQEPTSAATGAKDPQTVDALLAATLREREAIVWYLHHSGWAVKTRNHLLLFDPIEPPAKPVEEGEGTPNRSLETGVVDPDEIKAQDVFVFVTHDHRDHFSRRIFSWKESLPNSHFICGFRQDDLPDYVTTLRPHEERTFESVEVSTISSTDEGVGFVVQVDGLTVFHAGDHADWPMGDPDMYVQEIRRIAGSARPLDLMFFPVATGMGERDPSITYGAIWAICELQPCAAFPMHSGGKEGNYSEFVRRFEQGRFEDIPHSITEAMKPVPETRFCVAQKPGHRFRYADGKIE